MKAKLYRHFDKDGRLLYVGRSISALARNAQHMDSAEWANEIARIEIEPLLDDAHEYNVIAAEEPVFNRNAKGGLKLAYFGIKLEPELKRAVLDRAAKEGMDASAIIRMALRSFIQKPQQKRK